MDNAQSYLAYIKYLRGDYKGALEKLERIKLPPKSSPKDPVCLRHKRIKSFIKRELAHFDTALSLSQEIYKYRQLQGLQNESLCWAQGYVGLTLKEKGDYQKAMQLLKESTTGHAQYDNKTLFYWWLNHYYGCALRLAGHYKQAQDIFEKALAVYTLDHKNNGLSIGLCITYLAKLYRNIGMFEEAHKKATEGYHTYKKLFGKESLRTSWINMTRGQIALDREQYTRGVDLLEECLKLHRSMLPETHPKIGKCLIYLGFGYARVGQCTKGREYLVRGLANYEAHYGKKHVRTAEALRLLAEVELAQEKWNEAEALLTRSLSICQEKKHPDEHLVHECLARLYIENAKDACPGAAVDQDNVKKAENHIEKACALLHQHFPPHAIFWERAKKLKQKVSTIKV